MSLSKPIPGTAPNLGSIRLPAYSTEGLAPNRTRTANWQYQTDEQASGLLTRQHCLSPLYNGHQRVSRNRTPGIPSQSSLGVGPPQRRCHGRWTPQECLISEFPGKWQLECFRTAPFQQVDRMELLQTLTHDPAHGILNLLLGTRLHRVRQGA